MNSEIIKILVVEDNPVDVLRLQEDLREIGSPQFQIAHGENLQEAQSLLGTEAFHLILLDLGLPDSFGIDTLTGIQKCAPDIPIVVMSGLDDEILAREAVARGAQDYLLKGKWDGQLIVRSLHYAMQRHELLVICKQANESSQRANKALRVLSKCNELLVRATEEQKFLDDICRILVDHGQYRMAWIGFTGPDEPKTVHSAAFAGHEDGYFQAVKITWSDDETGRSVTGKAIRTGTPQINRDTLTNPDFTVWRREALKRGYASSIALPLTDRNTVFGALTIYSEEPDAFDDEEVNLLGQLAEDLSYGISTLRMRAAKAKADFARQESEQRFRAIFEGAQDCIFLKDRSLKFTLVNPAVENLFGIPASKVVGMRYEDLFGKEGAAFAKDLDNRVLQGESIEGEYTRRVNGTPITFLEARSPLRDGAGNIVGVFTIARDITERKGMDLAPVELDVQYPSEVMRSTLSLARVAAGMESTILLLGESGSGKDYLARYIHNCSKRADGPYICVNCAAIAPQLAESELFGHEKGAFTGALGRKRGMVELAEGGTLLLNEIGELSRPLQAKLLTFLDTKRFTRVGGEKEICVNARLIAATNRDLKAEVEHGRFRKDLFYRINVLSIVVPSLRDRREDIPTLTKEILSQLQRELKTTVSPSIATSMLEQMKSYNWPGNVRELRNVLERSMILSPDGRLSLELPVASPNGADNLFQMRLVPGVSLQEATDELARSLCLNALRACDGNKKAAARMLGISRDSLYRYLRKFGMQADD